MAKFVVIDPNYDYELRVCDTIEEALDVIQEFVENDGDSYRAQRQQIFALGEEIPFTITDPSVTLTNHFIPAPLPGETVSDYARRITGG